MAGFIGADKTAAMLDMHTHVWEHQPGTPVPTYDQLARMCDAATSKGVTEIAVTEHSYRFTRVRDEVLTHWVHDDDSTVREATDHVLDAEGGGDLDAYVEALVSAQDRGLPVLVGLEVDRIPGAIEAMGAVLDEYPFDFLLGSVHWLGSWLIDDYGTPAFADQWRTRSASSVWSAYVDAIAELAHSGIVDALAHVDLAKVSGVRPADLDDHEARLAAEITSSGIAVEISTAGWRKPAAELYPSPRLLDQLVAGGVPFTTASDAHTAELIGDGYVDLRTELANRGIDRLAAFTRRRRRDVAL